MAKLWRLLAVSVVVAVCLGLTFVPAVPPQVALADGNAGMEVQPATVTVGLNENFSVDIWANVPANQSWDTADAHLNFSPTYLEVVSIQDGALPIVLWSQFDNTNGTIDYTAGILEASVTGDQLVCTINFTSKSTNGVTTLDFVDIAPLRITDIIYTGTSLINWSMVVNGTVTVGVPPPVYVSPDSLAFNAIEEGENPPAQTLELCNRGSGAVDWSLTDDNTAWLSEAPTSGSLGEGECEDVTVSVDVTGMEAGDYSAAITITGSAELQVPVSLHIESAAPVGPANFSASALSISPQQVEPGEQVTISINVANTGGETGSYNAVLYINEVVEDSQSVSIAAGTSKNVIFTVSKSQAGVYDVSLAGQSGQFEVVSGGGWFGGGGLGTGGIIAIVVVVIAVIVGLFFILRGTRREV